ncbi:undecaprenyl diphosphate synthase family protein, partial [Salmonella sp. SAL4445]|uniref:undecaprenyl diphosphate synthase family protein n=1 Tax=Salmonella sp. SAL4445 TaxID=3159900 RepID=UPI0039795450
IEETEELSRDNQRVIVIMALNYGSRREITDAARRLAEEARAGRLDPDEIDEQLFSRCLSTAGVPDPDLLIRTSGEQRISNFLLWQLAYT